MKKQKVAQRLKIFPRVIVLVAESSRIPHQSLVILAWCLPGPL